MISEKIKKDLQRSLVEICRTIFEDKKEKMIYNVHKHNSHRLTAEKLWEK